MIISPSPFLLQDSKSVYRLNNGILLNVFQKVSACLSMSMVILDLSVVFLCPGFRKPLNTFVFVKLNDYTFFNDFDRYRGTLCGPASVCNLKQYWSRELGGEKLIQEPSVFSFCNASLIRYWTPMMTKYLFVISSCIRIKSEVLLE